LHQLPIEDLDVPLVPYSEWAPYEDEIAQTFVDLMRKAQASQSRSSAAAS
jgi:hypothetical protein